MGGKKKWMDHPQVKQIRERLLRTANIDLEAHIVEIPMQPWTTRPEGFKFLCRDREGLFRRLQSSPRFGRDRIRANHYREISTASSLHLAVDAKDRGVIHIDGVSIAIGKEPDGRVVYPDLPTIGKHIAEDLWHMDQGPILLPGEGGRRDDGWMR